MVNSITHCCLLGTRGRLLQIWQDRSDKVRSSWVGRNLKEWVRFTYFKMKKLRPRQNMTYPKPHTQIRQNRGQTLWPQILHGFSLANLRMQNPLSAFICFDTQLEAFGTKHKAVFALPGVNFYDKVTVIKRVGIGVKLDKRPVGHIGVPRIKPIDIQNLHAWKW